MRDEIISVKSAKELAGFIRNLKNSVPTKVLRESRVLNCSLVELRIALQNNEMAEQVAILGKKDLQFIGRALAAGTSYE